MKWLAGTFAAIASLFAALFFRNKHKQEKAHLRTELHNKDVLIKSTEAARPLDFVEVQEVKDNVKKKSDNHDFSGMFDPSKLRNKDAG